MKGVKHGLSFSCAPILEGDNRQDRGFLEVVPALDRAEQGVQATANSVRSVRRASGMEECGNTSGIQVPDEPLELSIIDHSMV